MKVLFHNIKKDCLNLTFLVKSESKRLKYIIGVYFQIHSNDNINSKLKISNKQCIMKNKGIPAQKTTNIYFATSGLKLACTRLK